MRKALAVLTLGAAMALTTSAAFAGDYRDVQLPETLQAAPQVTEAPASAETPVEVADSGAQEFGFSALRGENMGK